MKDQHKTLTPKLRFPEFGDGWLERPLGTVATEFQAKSTIQDEYEVLTSARIGLMKQVDYYGEGRITERDNVGFNIIPADYLTYRSRTDDGRFYFNHNTLGITGIISVYYPVFHSVDGSNGFLATLLNRFSASIGTHSVGTSQRVLPISKLLRIRLPIPSPAEQRKIAACLTSLDELLAAEGRKLEALRAHKKGLMQQLFPRKGESHPRLRFPEFRDAPEWEEKEIGDICEILNGRRIPISSSDRRPGPYPYYGASGIVDFVDNFIFDERLLLVGEDGAKWGAFEKTAFIAEGKYWVNNHAHVLRCVKVNDTLLENYLTMADVGPFITGNAPPKLTLAKLKSIPVPVPESEDEQQQIAACLSSLDALIAAQSRKLDGLQAHKKGLMQQLFPSPEGD
ncbi:MAG: restriction endonuclease subunit S [Phycisphaerae bacterium]|nr:restriction endonuclease subunit S [Planctomycetia bacterium]MCL4719346.1 restriction endonuclease subunit S [Phycisphaerae bacterium]